MSIEVKISDAGDEATILAWHKESGDQINTGERLVDVETAKTTLEIEAPSTGTLKEILKPVGEMISSEDVIAIIDAN